MSTATAAAGAELRESWIPMIAIALGQVIMSFNVAALPVSMGGMVQSFNVPPTTVGPELSSTRLRWPVSLCSAPSSVSASER